MNAAANPKEDLVPLGYIAGVHGTLGWVKVYSWTDPREAILDYPYWLLGDGQERFELRDGRRQGKSLLAALSGIEDRNDAEARVGQAIAVPRGDLPAPERGQYYWADLEGLEVVNTDGVMLGRVRRLLETGANDVLVLEGERERLVPWVPGRYVKSVDLETGRMVVDWDPED